MARTINSPGVEIFERDESESTVLQAGTNILVQGFAHQGPTNELIHISSKEELNQVYFGGNGPTNDAEQYFYHSCAEILNSPANLYTIRLPYGLNSGEGFSGKYVALAYGGSIDSVPVTSAVHRNVKEDDFIPSDKPNKTGTPEEHTDVYLYEFSKDTVLEDDVDTSAFYKAVFDYVLNKYEDFDPETESPFDEKYASAFPLENDKFWIETAKPDAYAICMEKTYGKVKKTYKVEGYDVSTIAIDVPVTKLFIPAPETSGSVEGMTNDEIDSYYSAAVENGNTSGEELTATVRFNNVGQINERFVDLVLNAPIKIYNTEKERLEDSEIHPLQGLNEIYSKNTDADGNITLYKISYGRALADWQSTIMNQLSATEFDVAIRTPDQKLADTYLNYGKNKLIRAVEDNGKLNLMVDTEEIADRLVETFSSQIDADKVVGIDFNGIPMQDALSQREKYNGVFEIDAINSPGHCKRYTINHYDNKLVTDRIKEIDVEEQCYDEDGEPIFKTVLTINPVPVAVPLSEYQYQAIKEGAVKYSRPVYNLDGEGTGYDAFRTILGKSAFYIINKMETSIDDKYQGFYVAMMDYSKFWEKSYGDPTKALDPIKEITYVSSPDDAGNVTIEVLPERAYHFDISGSESLSDDIMNKSTELVLSEKENFDNIVVATVRCGRRASSSDPSKLSYDLKDVTMGSFNVGSTIIDRITKGRVPNRIDTKMLPNDYMEFVINEKFELTRFVPKEVKFGGKEYPNRNQESGTCCSLGLEVPCEEENTAEYIGSVPNKIEKALSLCDNTFEFDLDILIDAGLTTIWAYVAEDSAHEEKGKVTYPGDCTFNASKYIENNSGTPYELLTRSGDDYAHSVYYSSFNTIRALFNTFCEKTRKDCMYLLDPIRAVFVRGRDTKIMDIDGKIFSLDVVRPLRNLFSNANSSYGASYANWVKIYDSFNDEFIWMPSSPFEASIMATVDANYYPWYAPYGLNNGRLSTITDIAIRPSQKQQDDLYQLGLNMFVYFNGDGFVSWGQKTLQTKASAFDRINVRRLFLTLERATNKAVRYFIAEPNTTFTRTRVVNALTPLFDIAKNNEGCYDYMIFCDERNNTAQVIDNNELVIDIYIKPTRVIDFIQCTFHATKTDANFEELFNG